MQAALCVPAEDKSGDKVNKLFLNVVFWFDAAYLLKSISNITPGPPTAIWSGSVHSDASELTYLIPLHV